MVVGAGCGAGHRVEKPSVAPGEIITVPSDRKKHSKREICPY